jgi:hypothetical protein
MKARRENMQPVTTIDISIVILPSILLGVVIGYFIGEMRSLRVIDRILLSIIASSISGVIISLLLNSIVPITTFSVVLSAMSVLGGLILGLWYNWTSPAEPSPKSHIIYEYDDDEFDREIDQALGRENRA